MAPASIYGPDNISNGEDTSSQINVPTMSFESSLIVERSLAINDSERGRSTDSDDADNLQVTCSSRTSSLNPLRTFRLIKLRLKNQISFYSPFA